MLALEGIYDVPGGFIGKIFDRFIGERLAFGTMDHLLRRLQHHVERHYRTFQRTSPTIEQLNLEQVSDKDNT